MWEGRLESLDTLCLSFVHSRMIHVLKSVKEFFNLKHFMAESVNLNSPSDAHDLGEFLNTQSSTLETLSMPELLKDGWWTPVCPVISFSIPQSMPKLTLLKIGVEKRSNIKLVPVNLPSFFPSLKTIIILHESEMSEDGNISAQLLASPMPHPNLTSLELPSCTDDNSVHANIDHLFPNLRHLCIGYHSRMAHLNISTECSNLESLILCCHPPPNYIPSDLDIPLEQLLTGFDSKQMNIAAASGSRGMRSKPEEPPITRLRRLRELTIHGGYEKTSYSLKPSGRKYIVGDIAFRYVFAEMPALRYLHITVENDVSGIYVMREACPSLTLKYAPDRDFIHLESDNFDSKPHSLFF
ncbi:uncharacterized protein LOC118436380 isoform X2 [Folsomia candida]|uniref:Uncharacterized protein n=1 Tax=Folsomia candida TaxID=158441 RepID=A0A226EX40_FOLCA|nr:uncharacterized protein LOC118436380 isoform X2 [Folsomia candida]OXA61401.1 hypothetical protein Fcan01_00992 [Folsomia candida]